MFGEGDLLRHLSQLTYKLMYHQDPLAEFDFSLASMSADLKDGLRLCKLAEALTGKMTLMVSHIHAQCNVTTDSTATSLSGVCMAMLLSCMAKLLA